MDKLKYNKSLKAYEFKNIKDIKQFNFNYSQKDYIELPDEQYYIDYKGVRIAAKRQIINPSSLLGLNKTFPEEGWLKPDIPSVPKAPQVILAYILPSSIDMMIKIYKLVCISDESPQCIIISKPSNLISWLNLFCVYENIFLQVYGEYICDPDDCIEFTDNLQEIYDILELEKKDNIIFSETDIKATCHVITISMNKTFPLSVREVQLAQYLKNRMSAVYSTLHSQIGNLKVKNDFFIELSETFKTLPKLRSALFFMLKYNQRIPEFATGMMLLAHSSMTALECISRFISLEKRTIAHSEPVILAEIKTFTDSVNRKKAEHGELWPYMRVLYPEDGDLNANKFPNLAVASVIYFHTHGMESHKQIAIPRMNITVDGLLEKAKTIDTRDIYKEKDLELNEDQKTAAQMIGLDIAKLRGTKRVMREMGAEEGSMVERLIEALRLGSSST